MDMSVEALAASVRDASEPPRLSPVVLSGCVGLIEGASTALTGLLVFALYPGADTPESLAVYTLAIVFVTGLQVAFFTAIGLYEIPVLKTPLAYAGRLAFAWSAVFAALLALFFLTKTGPEFSRAWLAFWFAAGGVSLAAFRIGLQSQLRRWSKAGRLRRRVVIVGADERAEKLIAAFEASPDSDIDICGIFDDRASRVPDRVRGYPVLGTVKALIEFARKRRVDTLIVTLPTTAELRILEVVKQLEILPVDIRLAAHSNALRLAPSSYSYVGRVPMLDVAHRPVKDWAHVVKAVEDRVLAALFLALASPVFAIVAVAIKFDSKGPVFFKQKRYGFNNELIEVYKFRSLRHDMADRDAQTLVTAGDRRVTRVGKFLRRASIDELPQLITVLKGHMSIVGPRPHATQAKAGTRLYQDVVDFYYARHRVKPGITGWAQINGWRGETDTEEKILKRTEYDLYYIDHWSLWFDLAIILKTPRALLKGEKAY
jgi:Undecaprenyl-phosphate glucose phosphotransferase